MNTRTSRAFIHIIAISLVSAGCQPKTRVALSSHLKMSDRSSNLQLIAGFYGLEQDRWRWTARRFAVVLQPPGGSERDGATLRLRLYIPDTEFPKLGPMSLTADVDDASLGSETFITPGSLSYSRYLPPALLRTDMLPIVFTFNRAS